MRAPSLLYALSLTGGRWAGLLYRDPAAGEGDGVLAGQVQLRFPGSGSQCAWPAAAILDAVSCLASAHRPQAEVSPRRQELWPEGPEVRLLHAAPCEQVKLD